MREATRLESDIRNERAYDEQMLVRLLPKYDLASFQNGLPVYQAMPMIARDIFNAAVVLRNHVVTLGFSCSPMYPLWSGYGCGGRFRVQHPEGLWVSAIHPDRPHDHGGQRCRLRPIREIKWDFHPSMAAGYEVSTFPRIFIHFSFLDLFLSLPFAQQMFNFPSAALTSWGSFLGSLEQLL
jgi:hypothetical protein